MHISLSEILLILLIALIVIKPQQLPDVAAKIGRFINIFRKFINKLKSEAYGLVDSIDKYEQKRKS